MLQQDRHTTTRSLSTLQKLHQFKTHETMTDAPVYNSRNEDQTKREGSGRRDNTINTPLALLRIRTRLTLGGQTNPKPLIWSILTRNKIKNKIDSLLFVGHHPHEADKMKKHGPGSGSGYTSRPGGAAGPGRAARSRISVCRWSGATGVRRDFYRMAFIV